MRQFIKTSVLSELLTIVGFPRLRRLYLKARRAGLETLLDYQRLALLSAAVDYTRGLEGDVIECGTYRGGSAAIIGQMLRGTDKFLHLCDSFKGLPEPGCHDNYHLGGDFHETSAALVERGLRLLDVPSKLHVGFFETTLPALAHLRFALAHIDVDLYSSVKISLEFCYPRMSTGGIIIFDDYGAPTCLGAKRAVDEFFAARPEKPTPLSRPAYAVCVGRDRPSVFEMLRPRAGWLSALPVLGAAVYRR